MRVVAIVLAAGRGRRLGRAVPEAVPKGLVELAGRSVLAWSAEALGRCPEVDAVQPVLPPDLLAAADDLKAGWTAPARLLEVCAGGARRQDSVRLGLAAARRAAPDLDWVLVHDAARCLVEPEDASAVLAAAAETGAALPVAPVTDTIKRLDGARVTETLERAALGRALTPQAFRAALLERALDAAERDGFEGTDCASLVERLGHEVRACAGRPDNWKLTLPEDLPRAEARLRARAAQEPAS